MQEGVGVPWLLLGRRALRSCCALLTVLSCRDDAKTCGEAVFFCLGVGRCVGAASGSAQGPCAELGLKQGVRYKASAYPLGPGLTPSVLSAGRLSYSVFIASTRAAMTSQEFQDSSGTTCWAPNRGPQMPVTPSLQRQLDCGLPLAPHLEARAQPAPHGVVSSLCSVSHHTWYPGRLQGLSPHTEVQSLQHTWWERPSVACRSARHCPTWWERGGKVGSWSCVLGHWPIHPPLRHSHGFGIRKCASFLFLSFHPFIQLYFWKELGETLEAP